MVDKVEPMDHQVVAVAKALLVQQVQQVVAEMVELV
jgi:hypothetical protein